MIELSPEKSPKSSHQHINIMENQDICDVHMMADYCWEIMDHCPRQSHSRKSLKRQFLNVQGGP